MSRLTLSDALSTLGDSVVAGQSVFPRGATDAQKVALINRANELLIGKPSWRGIDVLTTFAVYDNKITLPRELQSIKKAAVPPGGSGATAVPVNNMWFQFHVNGPGMIDSDHPVIATAQFVDIGLGAVTFLDPSYAFKIRIVSDVMEVSSTNISFYGTDANGTPIYTMPDLGETLDCSTSPNTTTQTFTTLTRVFKAVTLGRIKVYAVNASTGVATLMAIYEPGETTPCYRRYAVTGRTTETRTFTALCKRAFVKAVSGNDSLYPDNTNALASALRSIGYSNNDDFQAAAMYEKDAVGILNDELGEYLADTSPAVQIQVNTFAGAAIRNLR
jgi:hypothetical protein